jgi:hypothetical protein
MARAHGELVIIINRVSALFSDDLINISASIMLRSYASNKGFPEHKGIYTGPHVSNLRLAREIYLEDRGPRLSERGQPLRGLTGPDLEDLAVRSMPLHIKAPNVLMSFLPVLQIVDFL